MINGIEKYKTLFPKTNMLLEDNNYDNLKNHVMKKLLAEIDLITYKPPQKKSYRNFLRNLKKSIIINPNSRFFNLSFLNGNKEKKENKESNKNENSSNKFHIKKIALKNSKDSFLTQMKKENISISKKLNDKKNNKKSKRSNSTESTHHKSKKILINCQNNKTTKNLNVNLKYENYCNKNKLNSCFSYLIQSYNNKRNSPIIENKSYFWLKSNIKNGSTRNTKRKSFLNFDSRQQSAKLNSNIEKSIKNIKNNYKSINNCKYNYKIDYNFFNDYPLNNNKCNYSFVHQSHKKNINANLSKTEKKCKKILLKKIEDIDLITNKIGSFKPNDSSGRKQMKKIMNLSYKMDIIKDPENIENQFKDDAINYQKNIGNFVFLQNIGFYTSHSDCFLDKNNHIK